MKEIENDTHRRILSVADELFSSRGYASVTLRDIGDAVGMKHASLYYYAPGGKEQLFVEVMERNLKRHQEGLERAIADAKPDVRDQLRAVADWLVTQPPMDLVRMAHSDLPAIDKRKARRITELSYTTVIAPVERLLVDAVKRGEIKHRELGLVAAGLIGMLESLHSAPAHELHDPENALKQMAYTLIDVFLNGLRSK